MAYQVLSPGILIALSLAAVAALLNSFYWLNWHRMLRWRPAGLLAVAGAFMGTATFYAVLLVFPNPPLDITRGASRILWTMLCLSVIYNNSGSVALTVKTWLGRGKAEHG